MPLHHALAWLAVAALPLLAGVAAAIGAAYRKIPAIGVLLSALAVMGLVFAIIVPVAYRCSASWDVALATPRLLTPEERRTLRRTTPLCPAFYRFQRDGRDQCLVSDGDGGAFVGCG